MATECRETFAGALARPTPIDFTASTNDDGATSLASVIRYGKQAVKFLGLLARGRTPYVGRCRTRGAS